MTNVVYFDQPAFDSRKGQKIIAEPERHSSERKGSNERATNLLFGRYKLRLAREILNIDIETIAIRYDVSIHTWRKYEDGTRRLPEDKREAIEEDVREEVRCLF